MDFTCSRQGKGMHKEKATLGRVAHTYLNLQKTGGLPSHALGDLGTG